MKNIFKNLEKEGYRLCCVHLVDSYYCSSPSNYVSIALQSLSTMLHLELPHVNVLSKIDLIEKFGKLEYDLEYYTDAQDFGFINESLDNQKITSRYKKLNSIICEVVQDFGLLSYYPLDIQDKESVYKLLRRIDKGNGYSFSGLDKLELKKT